MYQEQVDEVVTIKLPRKLIPPLVSSIQLGMTTEDWCASLVQTAIQAYDTHSAKWLHTVGYILDEIKEQTKVTATDPEYATAEPLAEIQDMIDERCAQNTKDYQEIAEIEDKENIAQRKLFEAFQAALSQYQEQMEEVYEQRLDHEAK